MTIETYTLQPKDLKAQSTDEQEDKGTHLVHTLRPGVLDIIYSEIQARREAEGVARDQATPGPLRERLIDEARQNYSEVIASCVKKVLDLYF